MPFLAETKEVLTVMSLAMFMHVWWHILNEHLMIIYQNWQVERDLLNFCIKHESCPLILQISQTATTHLIKYSWDEYNKVFQINSQKTHPPK